MYVGGAHIEFLLLLSIFNKHRIASTNFSKNPQYNTSRKSAR